MCTTANYQLMSQEERRSFVAERIGTAIGRAQIADSFQAGALTVLPWSCALRLFAPTEEVIEEPDLTFEAGSNPLIDLAQIRVQRYDLFGRAFDLMHRDLTNQIDAWAFEIVEGVAQDLGTEIDDPAKWSLLDKAIGKKKRGWIFMNARTYAPYREGAAFPHEGPVIECGCGVKWDPMDIPDGRWENGKKHFNLEHRREVLRTGIQGSYKGFKLVVSRLVPAGSVYVTGRAGKIHTSLQVLSADEPPREGTTGKLGWVGMLKARARLGGPVFRYTHPV